jgi:hypothetical protein
LTERNADLAFCSTPRLTRLLEQVRETRRLVLAVEVPTTLLRISLYSALNEEIGRWGMRACDHTAFIDLANHPTLPAQTFIASQVDSWDDLADGLPEAMRLANILIVLGAEQVLADTPSRLTAFLEARARDQVVVVITPHASRVAQLAIRDAPVHLDRSLTNQADLIEVAKSVSRLAIAAARQATRREDGGAGAAWVRRAA